MTRAITVDLDAPDVAALEAVFHELSRRRAYRESDPDLLSDLERLAPSCKPDIAAAIARAIADEVAPAVILAEFLDDLVAVNHAGCPPSCMARRSSGADHAA
jgi:hypothetical protein